MRKITDFFYAKTKKNDNFGFFSRIKFHADGFSFSDSYSLRLGNIPKNLIFAMKCLFSLSHKTPACLISSFMFLIKEIQAQENCMFPPFSKISNVYLNHFEGNAFLLIQHNRGPSLTGDLNNTCGFFMENQQPGSYSQLGCACQDLACEGCTTSYNAILSGQNVTAELVNCMVDFINDYCQTQESYLGRMSYLIMGCGLFSICCCYCLYSCFTKLNKKRSEEPLLINEENESEGDRGLTRVMGM